MNKLPQISYSKLSAARWRLVAVAVVAILAWAAAAWLTPYQQPRVEQPMLTGHQQVNYVRAKVVEMNGDTGKARVLDGNQKGQIVPIRFYGAEPTESGEVVLFDGADLDEANAADPWRIPGLAILLALMVAAVVVIGGRQGVMSLVGLGISIAVIMFYIVPTAARGGSALTASIIGAFAIATIAILVAHRLRWRTYVALLSIYVTLVVVIALTFLSSWLVALSGVYDETSNILYAGGGSGLDMHGILLGGIIIASLGVLDDVVTTQVAAVDELREAKPHASWRELYTRGMSVGREHLSALINTLALAYVGVALPTVLIMSRQVENGTHPLAILNYEYISLEVVRTVISSLGIILAIPIATAMAVWLIGRKQQFLGILKRLQPNLRR